MGLENKLRPPLRERGRWDHEGSCATYSSAGPGQTWLRCCLAATLVTVVAPANAWPQDTPDYFRQNCMTCHTIGGGRLTGPDLKDVTQRKDRPWLVSFMMNPKAVIDSGDPYAAKIFQESRSVPMPTPPGITRERCEKLLDLIEAESQLESSQFKGLQVSTKPFTDADRERGRNLFSGHKPLKNGGAACIGCHSIHGMPALGGGRLGPDLTKVYERLEGRKALSAWLVAPATATMQPIFKNHPLTAEQEGLIENGEIHALVAFFEAAASQSEVQPTTNRVAFLLMGLAGATALIFGFDAIWKRRFHSVRRPLADGQAT